MPLSNARAIPCCREEIDSRRIEPGGTAVKESRGLEGLFADIFQYAHDVLMTTNISASLSPLTFPSLSSPFGVVNPPLGSLSHIPRDIPHLLPPRQKLIQILDALPVLGQKFAFSGYRLARLDQVQDEDGGTVSLEEVVEVESGRGVEGVFDGDYGISC